MNSLEIHQLPRIGDADRYMLTIDGKSVRFDVSGCSLKVTPPRRRPLLVFYAACKAIRGLAKEKAPQC
jgi:hypothetical protein